MKNALRLMIAGLMIVSVVAASGCRKTPKKDPGPVVLDPTGPLEPTALVAGDRFEDTLTRVTDVTFENVLFDYDSYQIKASEAGKVDKVAEYMKANPNVRLVTEGNCDERGTIEYNLALGENRAAAVRAQLISLGIPAENIQTKSYGEEKPVEAGHSETSWRVNRRTEFALYK